MAPRRRLDAELVRRGLCADRPEAHAVLFARRVLVAGAPTTKPDRLVAAGDPIIVQDPPPRYVSRGGAKLEAALDRFGVDPAGQRAIDVGSSTGGFTDCLLQRGAHQVVAIDAGRNQLHERLRHDPRVSVHEQTNVRHVEPGSVGGPAELVVADLSFISLRAVTPALLGLVTANGRVLVLVKPQFEADRVEASRGRGVVRDPMVWHRVLVELQSHLLSHGAAMMEVMVSPITGADGNVEFLTLIERLAATPGRAPLDPRSFDDVVASAVDRAGADR